MTDRTIVDGATAAGQVSWDLQLKSFRVVVTDGDRVITQWSPTHRAAVALARAIVASLDSKVPLSAGRYARWSRKPEPKGDAA